MKVPTNQQHRDPHHHDTPSHPTFTPAATMADLRHRHITITTHPNGPHLTGPATPTDHTWANQHTHALHLAATGNHPRWWNTIRAGTTTANPHALTLTDIPTADTDPDAFACATCGNPAANLDQHWLSWCPQHEAGR